MRFVYSSSANTIAARSLISNCIATTAGTPSCTSVVATPAYGSVSVVRAPSHELRTTSRSAFWSDSRLANSVSSTSTGVAVVGVLEVDDAVAGRREVAVPDVVDRRGSCRRAGPGGGSAARPARASRGAPARSATTGASACSMRRRSPSTSSGARSRGLATMPRMRTAPSITGAGRQRAGLEQAHDRGAPLAGEEAGPLVEELPRDAQQRRRAGERQRHAGAVPVGLGAAPARPGRPPDVAAQQRLGQRAAEALGVDDRPVAPSPPTSRVAAGARRRPAVSCRSGPAAAPSARGPRRSAAP